MLNEEKLIHLGSCAKPHGITGGLSAHFFNPQDSSVKKGSTLLLRPKSDQSSLSKNGESYEVSKISFGNKVILFLKGVDNRNKVEEIIPFEIYITRDQLPEPLEGEYYLEDLVGLKVVSPTGEHIGEVNSYFDNGAQTVLVIQKLKGKLELPFVEAFFPEVDFDNGTITMLDPEII